MALRWRLVAILAVGLAVGWAGAASALPANPFTGQWLGLDSGPNGRLTTFTQSGSGITGSTPGSGSCSTEPIVIFNGTASADGATAEFTYSAAPGCPGHAGTFQARMRPDGLAADVRGVTQFGTPFQFTITYQSGGTEPRTPPPPPSCPAPPRLRTESQAQTSSCTYRVAFSLLQIREPIQNAARISTIARGFFSVTFDTSDTRGLSARGCTDPSDKRAVILLHEHLRIDDDDIVIRAGLVDNRPDRHVPSCLRRRPPRGTAVAFTVEFPIQVTRSNDRGCRVGEEGQLTVRAGAPFAFAVLGLCGHRELFSPSRPGRPQTSAVNARITVSPAG